MRYAFVFIGLFAIYIFIKRFRPENILLWGISLSSIGFLGSGFFHNSFCYILFAFPLNFGAILTIISCWTLLSYKGGKHQGLLMSVGQLSWALSWMFSGICAIRLAQSSVALFFIIDAICSVAFLAGVIWYERRKTYCFL
jgi:MFS family permease